MDESDIVQNALAKSEEDGIEIDHGTHKLLISLLQPQNELD